MGPLIDVAVALRRMAAKSRAQVVMLISVALVVVLGMSALAVDVGNLWTTRRRMQSAADAAAIAGVDAIAVGESGSAVTDAARDAATQNGFSNGSTSTTSTSPVSVAVYNPPQTGSYQGLSNAVQVVVAQTQPTYFMRVLGLKTVPVSTTATALAVASGACILSLNPSASGAITISGTGVLNPTCGIYDNSDSSSALTMSGSSVIASSTPFVGVVGGTNLNGGASTPVTTGIPNFGDPLAWIAQPTVDTTQCPQGSFHQANLSGSVNPGYFCGGIHIASGSTVNFSPGLYIIDGGGMQIDGGATVSGSGVTFFLTGQNTSNGSPNAYAGVNIQSNANVTLSAPCSSSNGSIAGMLFFQDRSITNGVGSTVNGGSGSSFSGALYFPTTPLSYSGSTIQGGYTLLVSNTLTINGMANLGNNESCIQGGPLIRDATLVE